MREVICPKGVYKTPHGFRVQLNLEHQHKRRNMPRVDESGNRIVSEKFSRNTKQFEDVSKRVMHAVVMVDCTVAPCVVTSISVVDVSGCVAV